MLEVFVLLAGVGVLLSGIPTGDWSPFRVILGGIGVVLGLYFLLLYRPRDGG